MKYAYSHCQEDYHGQFDTPEEAAAAGFDDADSDHCWVGECHPPTQPEDHIDADLLIEHVSCQDEYNCDWSSDWYAGTSDQEQELTRELRSVFAAWLDRHSLRPGFYMIENAKRYDRVDGQPQLAKCP